MDRPWTMPNGLPSWQCYLFVVFPMFVPAVAIWYAILEIKLEKKIGKRMRTVGKNGKRDNGNEKRRMQDRGVKCVEFGICKTQSATAPENRDLIILWREEWALFSTELYPITDTMQLRYYCELNDHFYGDCDNDELLMITNCGVVLIIQCTNNTAQKAWYMWSKKWYPTVCVCVEALFTIVCSIHMLVL